jgi:hypothetical protein
MSRLIAVVAWGFMLAACSATMPNLNLDFMKSAPQAETLAIESEPPGAEAKTSLGQSCLTPCQLSVQPGSEFSVMLAKGLPAADGVGASGGGGRNCSAAAQAQPGSRGPAGGDAEEADCEEKEARCDTNACACCCPGALSLGSGTIRDQLSLAVVIVPIGSRVAGAGISFG